MGKNEGEGQTIKEERINKSEWMKKNQMIDGINVSLYRQLTIEIGPPARRKKRINVKLAKKMHDAGWSYRQIGLHFNVSGYTVKRRLNESPK